MKRNYTLHVVTHSHLDREWYASFQHFRLRLVRLFDRVLDLLEREPEGFRSFHGDGQTQVLDDYLEIRPDRGEELKRRVREGRFVVGPWCILPDEFLVCGEAHIRNLELGRRAAQAAGADPATQVGYLPDMFGHLSQMPQILAGFGLEHAILWRGLSKPGLPAELWWESPDGTRVKLFHLPWQGYSNCPIPTDIPVEEAVEVLAQARNQEAERTSTSHLLLMNGTDHAVPREDIVEVLRRLQQRFPEDRVVHGTVAGFLEACFAEVDWSSAPTVLGELRDTNWEPGGRFNFALPNVLSSRIYLKQADYRVCNLLLGWAEPAAAQLGALLGDASLVQPVRAAWAELVKNHAHDSIGGCSIDPVHRQMETRFEWAQELGEAATETAHFLLAQAVDTSWVPEDEAPVVLFTQHPEAREDVLTGTLSLPRGLAQAQLGVGDPEPLPPSVSLTLRDSRGRDLPAQVLSLRREDRFEIPDLTTWAPHRAALACEVAVAAGALPALGFQAAAARLSAQPAPSSAGDPHVLENEHLRVTLTEGGCIALLDKATGHTYRHLSFFEDGGDAGDGYTYSPPVGGDLVIDTRDDSPVAVTSVAEGPLVQTRRVVRNLQLPAGLDTERKQRDTHRPRVTCELALEVTLKAGARRVELRAELRNQACDHRLRAVFPTGIQADEWLTDSQFDIVRRPVDVPQPPQEVWIEDQPRQLPLQSWAAVRREDGSGLAVATRGLKECEVTRGQDGLSLHLTLLRAVAWLGAPGDQVSTIVAGAGPGLPTPESQCLRTLVFEYAVIPFESEDGLVREAEAYARPSLRAVAHARPPAGSPSLGAEGSFLSLEAGGGVALSAVKPTDDGGGVFVRVFNPHESGREARLRFFRPPSSLELCRLDGASLGETVPVTAEGTAALQVPPKRILTLLARWK